MPKVRCTVNNCLYWDEGNRCGADEILIINTRLADIDDDKVEIADLGYTPAAVSSETACKTFRRRTDNR